MLATHKLDVLAKYRQRLEERKLAPSNHIPFYTSWARQFLQFKEGAGEEPPTIDILLDHFLKHIMLHHSLQDCALRHA